MASYLGNDDAFGDEFEDDRVKFENEWERNASARLKEGYKDGLEVGQDLKLQEGFNEGYKNTAPQSAEIARLKGCVSAILAFNILKKGSLLTKEGSAEFESILSEITLLQEMPQSVNSMENIYDKDNSTSEMSTIKSMAEQLGLLGVKNKSTNSLKDCTAKQVKTEGKISLGDTGSEQIGDFNLIESRATTLQDPNQTDQREVISVKEKLNRLLTTHNLQHLL